MARKRMFDLEIINQDSFLDLPMESKALYFLLGMEADDEGFVAPRKVLRLYGGTEDGLKVLIAKNFIIPFSTGVIVITDWKRNNYLDKNKVKETIYQDEKRQLQYNEQTEKYESLTKVKQKLNQYSIEENSIEENSINIYSLAEQDNIPYKKIIDYLNKKTNSNYKYTTDKTKKFIKARINEGFTYEDFKTVIDKKTLEWINDKEMSKYLRPETLFGTKFESYLNQISNNNDEPIPDWFEKDIDESLATPEEQQEMEDLLSEFK